jgi:hypothetical protein
MSKIALSGNASGTGTLTIAAPNTSTDRTLTLPDNTGTILTNATTAGFPAGSVLQVVSTTKTDTFSRTSSSSDFGDVTGLSVSITPSSASNKILILANVSIAAASGQRNGFRILRNSTVVDVGDTAGSRVSVTAASSPMSSLDIEQLSAVFLDSPNTTLSTIYKIQITVEGSQLVYVNRGSSDTDNNTNFRTVSSITVMEIAA